MKKPIHLLFVLIVQILFYACQMHHDRETICYENYKKAKELAFRNPDASAALDSALIIINRCMKCDSVKTAAVELKIRLLITLEKFKEGVEFIDSLQVSDFTFPYKKTLNHDNFIALNFASKMDTAGRDKIYQKMSAYLGAYIKNNNLKSKEFREAFTELNALRGNFIDSVSLPRLIDSIQIKYPGEEKFLNFFRH